MFIEKNLILTVTKACSLKASFIGMKGSLQTMDFLYW